jgi:hypothetical protein
MSLGGLHAASASTGQHGPQHAEIEHHHRGHAAGQNQGHNDPVDNDPNGDITTNTTGVSASNPNTNDDNGVDPANHDANDDNGMDATEVHRGRGRDGGGQDGSGHH